MPSDLPPLPSPIYTVPSGDGYGARYFSEDQLRAFGHACRVVDAEAALERFKTERGLWTGEWDKDKSAYCIYRAGVFVADVGTKPVPAHQALADRALRAALTAALGGSP